MAQITELELRSLKFFVIYQGAILVYLLSHSSVCSQASPERSFSCFKRQRKPIRTGFERPSWHLWECLPPNKNKHYNCGFTVGFPLPSEQSTLQKDRPSLACLKTEGAQVQALEPHEAGNGRWVRHLAGHLKLGFGMLRHSWFLCVEPSRPNLLRFGEVSGSNVNSKDLARKDTS